MSKQMEITVQEKELIAKLAEVRAALDASDWNKQYELMKQAQRISFRLYMITDNGSEN